MCEALPINRLTFRYKRCEYGWEAKSYGYTITIGRNNYFWWTVEKQGFGQIAESDFAYKTDAATFKQAKYLAKKALHQYLLTHD